MTFPSTIIMFFLAWIPFLRGEQYQCDKCSSEEKRIVKKPLEAFTAAMKKRIMVHQKKTGLLCHECQCPPCLKCGKRAEDADSKTFRMQESYYCEECKGDHKLKKCKKCGISKSLTCYPRECTCNGYEGR